MQKRGQPETHMEAIYDVFVFCLNQIIILNIIFKIQIRIFLNDLNWMIFTRSINAEIKIKK